MATATTPSGIVATGAMSRPAIQLGPNRRRTRCQPSSTAPARNIRINGTSGRNSSLCIRVMTGSIASGAIPGAVIS